jgi:hypothetical protein
VITGPDAEAAGVGAPLWGTRERGRQKKAVSYTFILCSLMMAASLIMVIWNLQEGSLENANTGSRYATIESLVDRGTFYIDHSRYVRTIDKYKVGEHYISSKPPALPAFGAGVYWIYKELTGKTIARHEGDVVRLVSLCTGGLCHLIFLIFFYRLCLLLMKRRLAVAVAMAGACFAYLGVGYATHINNHSTAAALGVCGLYYACRIRREPTTTRVRHWLLAGGVLGLLPTVDLSGLAITGCVGLYLLTYDWKKTLLLFVPALLPALLVHFALTYSISGSFRPFYMNQSLKNFSEFHFRRAGGIDGFREPKYIYAFNVLLGHHGLFSMTPLYAFGLWELLRSIRHRRYFAESLVCAGVVLAFIAFYIFRSRNYGGWCVGMRWLMPAMPLLLLYFGLWVDRVRLTRPLWLAVLLAFSVSCFHVQDALDSPFQFSVWHNWLEGQPNRNRVGKTFNLAKRSRRSKRARPPKAAPATTAPAVPGSAPPSDTAPSDTAGDDALPGAGD